MSDDDQLTRRHRARRRLAWVGYDFANSAFPTLVTTWLFAPYFTQTVADDPISGTAWWSGAVTVSALLVALSAPLLGQRADTLGVRRRYWLISTLLCVVGTALLVFAAPGWVIYTVIVFAIANTAYELATVFYNAYLPDIAEPTKLGQVSGEGFAAGYAGGLLALAIALLLFVLPSAPLQGERGPAWSNLVVALWFAAFAWPALGWIPEISPSEPSAVGPLLALRRTWQHVRSYPQAFRLLIARLVYNDGLVTLFYFGGIYAAGTFGFTMIDLLIFGIVLNVAAAVGAWLFGFVDDRWGGRRTILVSLALLIVATVIGLAAQDQSGMWLAGVLIGLASGPNQAASRSLLSRLVPIDRQTEFFGLFAFSGKATAFLGPLLLGQLTLAFDSQRAGVAVVLAFFIVGALLLLRVKDKPEPTE